MRKVLVVLTLLWPAALFAAQYELREEYRFDVVDFEEDPKHFWRQNFSVKPTKTTAASLSHNYIQESNDHIFTGYLNLKDEHERFRFVAGNYNINFGSGLFYGTRQYISADPFASTPFPAAANFISPSGSASPVYSLCGLGASVLLAGMFEISAFGSLRRRYILSDYYDNGKVASSMNSINARPAREGRYNEPVFIRDIGLSLALNLDSFYAAVLFYYKDVSNMSGGNIVWEYIEDDFGGEGIHGSGGSAIYFRYRDEYIFMFCEAGLSFTQHHDSDKKEPDFKAYGTSAGFRFRRRTAAFSLFSVSAGPWFYAPEASRNIYPRHESHASASVKMFGFAQLGTAASYERKEYPGKNEAALSTNIKEGLFAVIGNKTIEANTRFDISRQDKAAGRTRLTKEAAALRWMFVKNVSLIAKGQMTQRETGATSWAAGGGIQGEFFNGAFRFGFDTTYYTINGPAIYATVLPAANALVSTAYVNSSRAVSTLKFSVKFHSIRLTARLQQSFERHDFGASRMEFFGRAVF